LRREVKKLFFTYQSIIVIIRCIVRMWVLLRRCSL
jgi:hypothetical protein